MHFVTFISLPATPTFPLPSPDGITHPKNPGYFFWSIYTSTCSFFIHLAYTSYCADCKTPSLSLFISELTPRQSTIILQLISPIEVITPLDVFVL